jgi:hypothetical protein
MSQKRLFSVLLVLVPGLLVGAPAVAAPADDVLVVNDCSYGDVHQFTPAGCTASLENRGAEPLVLSIIAVQPGNTARPDRLTLAPHARAPLSLRVDTDNIAGAVTWTFRIERAGVLPQFVHASGFVTSVLDVAHPEIDFGAVDPASLPLLRTIALTSSLDPRIRVKQVLSAPSMLHAVVGPDGKSLTVQIGADAPWGLLDDTIRVALDHPQQKQAWVHVTGSMAGEIAPPANPQWLGEIAWQPENVLKVPLIDRDGRDFSIGTVTSTDFAAIYGDEACEPARAGCRELLIHVSESQPSGMFKGHLDVALPDRKKHLMLQIWGVLGERPKPGEAAAPPEVRTIPVPKSSTDDGVTAIPPLKVQPDPPGNGPLLKWTIDQQQSVHGYQVLRAESPDGPFTLMDPHLIPKVDNGRGAVAYRWRDTSAQKGHSYWYYIAVIYRSGDRRALSSPQKTLAK